jgi:hypothetical protein
MTPRWGLNSGFNTPSATLVSTDFDKLNNQPNHLWENVLLMTPRWGLNSEFNTPVCYAGFD